jgi:hypothetical protein
MAIRHVFPVSQAALQRSWPAATSDARNAFFYVTEAYLSNLFSELQTVPRDRRVTGRPSRVQSVLSVGSGQIVEWLDEWFDRRVDEWMSTFLLTYFLLTPCSRVLLEKLTGFAASQEIPRIYGTQDPHLQSDTPPGVDLWHRTVGLCLYVRHWNSTTISIQSTQTNNVSPAVCCQPSATSRSGCCHGTGNLPSKNNYSSHCSCRTSKPPNATTPRTTTASQTKKDLDIRWSQLDLDRWILSRWLIYHPHNSQ